MILSGPNGVGKTAESYLLPSVACVNGAVLIYRALAQPWRKEEKQQTYLVQLAAGLHNYEL
ncbi:hypothetical protein QOT17_014044 [Balamuthia mandrillaris]